MNSDILQSHPYLRLPGFWRYRFLFRVHDSLRLPPYTSSTWRGLLGHGLRRVACVTGAHSCYGCLLRPRCVYTRIFESPAPAGDRGHWNRPHPYVLSVPGDGRGEARECRYLELELGLLGAANKDLPYVVEAFRASGRLGLGKARTPFSLERVEHEPELGGGHWKTLLEGSHDDRLDLPETPSYPVPDVPSKVVIELITPLRIKCQGHLLGPREFQASDFLRQPLRRCRSLAYYFGNDADATHWPLPQSRAETANQNARLDLRWQEWTRKSSRQRCRMQLGGVIGTLHMDGAAVADWWPLIWIGQWLHLGKATTMGLGCYRIRTSRPLRKA